MNESRANRIRADAKRIRADAQKVRQQAMRLRTRTAGKAPAPAPDPDPETDDWWTTTDIATFLGLKVGTISSYRSRGQMPAPDKTIGRTNVWRPWRIIEWRNHGRSHGPGPDA